MCDAVVRPSRPEKVTSSAIVMPMSSTSIWAMPKPGLALRGFSFVPSSVGPHWSQVEDGQQARLAPRPRIRGLTAAPVLVVKRFEAAAEAGASFPGKEDVQLVA